MVRNGINFEVLHKWSTDVDSIVTIKVSHSRPYTVTCIYRAPNLLTTTIQNFFDNFEPILAAVAHTNAYIIGDFNINLL